jgi:sortase A
MTPPDREPWPERPAAAPPPARPPREPLVVRAVAALAFVSGCIPRRRAGRRALGVLTVLMLFAGVLLLSYPFITDFQARHRQNRLTEQFASREQVEAYRRRQVEVGGALTRLIIPRFGACPSCPRVNVIVVEGITGNALRAGAGHYPTTPLPGEMGNVAIAGHRTGFGEPFRNLDKLRPGDQIILQTPLGTYIYEVVGPFDGHGNPWVTHPRDFSVLSATPDAVLTLTTCDPPHTSKNRLIVRARLVRSEPIA